MKMQYIKDSQRRYNQFIDKTKEELKVWGLKSDNGWAVVESNEYMDTFVMLFWSDKSYAAQCAVEEWSDYVPTAIPLKEFSEIWLTGLKNDDLLVGINWTKELVGMEVEPLDLVLALKMQ